jgi:antitoxin YefM
MVVQLFGTNNRSSVMAISASEARQRLFPLLEQVNTDHEPVRITSKAGDAVLMSADDYDSWQETVYLLRSPENARRLMEAVARDRASQPAPTVVATSIDDLMGMAGGQE